MFQRGKRMPAQYQLTQKIKNGPTFQRSMGLLQDISIKKYIFLFLLTLQNVKHDKFLVHRDLGLQMTFQS